MDESCAFFIPDKREGAGRAAEAVSTYVQQTNAAADNMKEIYLDQHTWEDEVLDDVGVEMLIHQFQ